MNWESNCQSQIDLAKQIRRETPVPVFTENEKRILGRVFSNSDKNTYFIYGLPEELITTLLARYSRIKNLRGLRGLFLEDFITNIPVMGKMFTDPVGFLNEYGDRAIDKIPIEEIEQLIGMGFSLKFYSSIVTAEKIKTFLKKFLDDYGHNSIARMGIVHLAVENVSLLAAKAIEWARPGVGYIELSTRFVDMSAREVYPIWKLFDRFHEDKVKQHIYSCLEAYQKLYPICKSDFENKFAEFEPNNAAITGKICDSLGNLLPCATLTSLGVSMMGEAFQSVIRHLLAEENPECYALAKEITEESAVTGNNIMLGSHFVPSPLDFNQYEIHSKRYTTHKPKLNPYLLVTRDFITPNSLALESIVAMSGLTIDETFLDARSVFDTFSKNRVSIPGSYQKLPDWFEHSSAIFSGLMSFRSWRDLQRMGFCTHKRGWVTPNYGAYLPPDMPLEFLAQYEQLWREELGLFNEHTQTETAYFNMLAQYTYMIGNFVPFIIGANLREWEFVNWQRSKWGVNEEVRKVVLKAEQFLRDEYPWWQKISRADTTWEYIFARGNKIIPKS